MNNLNTRNIIIDCLENAGILINSESMEDVDLTSYSIDSMSFILFVIELEVQLNITIPDNLLLVEILQSLNGFIALIEELLEHSDDDKS